MRYRNNIMKLLKELRNLTCRWDIWRKRIENYNSSIAGWEDRKWVSEDHIMKILEKKWYQDSNEVGMFAKNEKRLTFKWGGGGGIKLKKKKENSE